MFLHKIGSRKTVPFRIFLMVLFGLRHIDLSLNSFNSSLIRSYSSALNSNIILQCRLRALDSDLIITGVPVKDTEIKILHIQLQVREDELILYHLPYDPRHLIASKGGTKTRHRQSHRL
uniref:Uncharacterized protein n=1 Tax=Arundo donax TaxID=35708 RepID=A0A0A9H181_ARUDO